MLELLEAVGGSDLPVRVVSPHGDSLGADDAETTLRIVSPDAIHRIVTARGQQLGFARAIVAGDTERERRAKVRIRAADGVCNQLVERFWPWPRPPEATGVIRRFTLCYHSA